MTDLTVVLYDSFASGVLAALVPDGTVGVADVVPLRPTGGLKRRSG
jgi:hypothetical protein